GAFRRVYPGFVQLAAFMSMNVERHLKAHRELYDHLAKGEHEKGQVTMAFYDEYFAVLDLTAEFYLETVRLVFQECALPTGKLEWQGGRVEPRAIKRTMLLTVEGERDDICAVGQTAAAQACFNPALAPGAGWRSWTPATGTRRCATCRPRSPPGYGRSRSRRTRDCACFGSIVSRCIRASPSGAAGRSARARPRPCRHARSR